MKKDNNISYSLSYERLFKITKKNYIVDLTGSLSIIQNKASEAYFKNEIFKLSFCINHFKKPLFYNILTTANECFNQHDLCCLKQKLGVTLIGCGMHFKIIHFKYNFTIQIDTKNSLFIDTPSVKSGLIHFIKKQYTNNLFLNKTQNKL